MPTAAAASSSTARLRIYHVSGWGLLASLRAGDAFELVPGSQHAEGPGVYFSEGVPRLTAAEGAAGRPTAIVEIDLDAASVSAAAGWWRSKASVARKRGRPLTWHSAGARVACVVREVGTLEGLPLLRCVARRVVV